MNNNSSINEQSSFVNRKIDRFINFLYRFLKKQRGGRGIWNVKRRRILKDVHALMNHAIRRVCVVNVSVII